MDNKEALDNLYICATNAKSETLEEGYYENCFYVVANKIDEVEADLYEANNRIADLLLILGDKDRMINEMAKYIDDFQMECNKYYKDKEDVIKTFEKRCKDAKD